MGLPKSLSRESAFTDATDDSDAKCERVRRLAAAVADRARGKEARYRTIGIKVVETPYDVNTRERSLPGPVDEPDLVEEVALDLLSEFEDSEVRKAGVRVSNLSFDDADQANLDAWEGEGDGNWADGARDWRAVDGERERRRSDDGQASLEDFE